MSITDKPPTIDERLIELYWALSNVADAPKANDLEQLVASTAILELHQYETLLINNPALPIWMLASSIIDFYVGKQQLREFDPQMVHVYTATLPDPSILTAIAYSDDKVMIDLTTLPQYRYGQRTLVDSDDLDIVGKVPWLVVMDVTDQGRSKVIFRTGESKIEPRVYH